MTGDAERALIPPWGLALAGASGAVLANALVYPLDIVKTRLQVQEKRNPGEKATLPNDERHYDGAVHAIQSILKDEGIQGLYSGMTGSLIGVASQNFAYFYWYSIVRSIYLVRSNLIAGSKPSTAAELSLGAAAGALAQVFTIPIAVVTTRQQTRPKGDKRGILETAKEVVESEDGWTGLWRGMKASLVLVVNPSITYGAYERLKQLMYPHRTSLRAHEAFLLGAMSKALATCVTQPLIVAKVGLQSRPPSARMGKPFRSFVQVMEHIVATEGLLGLFKGIGPQLAKGLLVQGFLMMTKERFELLFIVLFMYIRRLKARRLQDVADLAAKGVQSLARVS